MSNTVFLGFYSQPFLRQALLFFLVFAMVAPFAFALAPDVPVLNAPANASTVHPYFTVLNVTVTDPEGDSMNVSFFGSTDNAPTQLLAYFEDVANGTELTYNWSSPVANRSDPFLHGFFRFDKNATDYSSQGNDGSLTGNAFINTTDGRVGGALVLDGDGDYVDISDAFSTLTGDVSSVTAWIKIDTYDTFGSALLNTFGLSGVYWQIRSDTEVFVMSNSVNVTSTDFDDGTWRHVAFTSDGTTSTFYVNGVYAGSDSDSVTSFLSGAKTFAVGKLTDRDTQEWNGSIDELTVWNKSLTATEVQDIYELSLKTYYWRVNASDGSGSALSEAKQFSVTNNDPNVAIAEPVNASSTTLSSQLINVSVTDSDNTDFVTVSLYGGTSTNPTELLVYRDNAGSGSVVFSYNWTAPLVNSSDPFVHGSFRFDEDLNDSSSQGNTGSFVGDAFINATSGYLGGSLVLDGSGDYFNLPSTFSSVSGSVVSVTAWIKIDSYDSSGSVLLNSGALPGSYWQIRSDTDVRVMSNAITVSSTDFDDGTWRHIALVSDGSNSTVYVNGENIGSDTDSVTALASGAKNVVIGRIDGSSSHEWNGAIDEFALWNKSLTHQEVLDLYRLKNDTYHIRLVTDDKKTTLTEHLQFTIGPSSNNDDDGDGVDDSVDTLRGNLTHVQSSGLQSGINITFGDGSAVNSAHSGVKTVEFRDGASLLVNFSHNFSSTTLNLSKVSIVCTSQSVIVNLSGQLNFTKSLFVSDPGFSSLCVVDRELSSVGQVSASCTGVEEYDFTSCLGNSSGVTISGIDCYDLGSVIRVDNLTHSGIRGTGGASISGASILNEGASSSFTESSSGSDNSQGANVTEINFSTTASTTKWQGYFGNVEGNLRMGSGSSVLYSFGSLPVSQVASVFASTDNNFDFSATVAAGVGDVDTIWGFISGDADSGTNVFSDGTATLSDVNSVPIANLTAYTSGGDLSTSIYQSGVVTDGGSISAGEYNSLAFGVNVDENERDFSNSTVVDFELIVPVNGSGAISVQTYYFFMDIN